MDNTQNIKKKYKIKANTLYLIFNGIDKWIYMFFSVFPVSRKNEVHKD